MKRYAIILFILLTGCSGTKFYFFGVDMEWVKKATWKDAGVFAVGAFSGFAVHELGHEITKDRTAWEGRSGFLAQNLTALVLTSFEETRYGYFTRGMVAMNAVQTWSYPIRRGWNGGDLELMGDDAKEEWALYSALALHNTLRICW